MSRLVYSPAAKADLDGIWSYTLERWGAVQAERYIREIDAACRALAAGTRTSKAIDDIRPGYRKAFVHKHVVYLRVTETGDTAIVRILHARMDVERHLPSRD